MSADDGVWVKVWPEYVPTGGTPGAPVITNPDGGGIIYFTAATEGTAGPTIAYGAIITPNDNGETVDVDQNNLEVTPIGTQSLTDYVVGIYAVNEAGIGGTSNTNEFQVNYNEATGGSITTVDDYNGTGEQWNVHTFTSSGTLSVVNDFDLFRVVTSGAGGGGSGAAPNLMYGGRYGGHGEGLESNEFSLPQGAHSLVVGTGGNPGGVGANGGPGGLSSISSQSSTGGGGANSLNTLPAASPDGPVKSSDISGTVIVYGSEGGRGGGGGGVVAEKGVNGVIVVAYQIGMSSTTQIKNAQSKQAARSEGYEVGHSDGYVEGFHDSTIQALAFNTTDIEVTE